MNNKNNNKACGGQHELHRHRHWAHSLATQAPSAQRTSGVLGPPPHTAAHPHTMVLIVKTQQGNDGGRNPTPSPAPPAHTQVGKTHEGWQGQRPRWLLFIVSMTQPGLTRERLSVRDCPHQAGEEGRASLSTPGAAPEVWAHSAESLCEVSTHSMSHSSALYGPA